MISEALFETVELIKTVAPIMLISLLVSNFVFSLPQFKRILKPIERLSRFANLKSGIAISAFLIHPIVGISILSKMYKSKLIDFKEAVISILIAVLPQSIRIIVLFLAPLSISLLGFELGLKFLMLEFSSKLIVVAMGVLIGKVVLMDNSEGDVIDYEYGNFKLRGVFILFFRTVAVIFLSAFLVSIVLKLNLVFEYLKFLPKEIFMIVISGIASTTAGMSVASSLLSKGLIDGKTTLLAIFLSRFFHVFVESIRISMPIYTSFFGFRVGFKLLIVQISCKLLSISLAIALISLL